MFVQTYKHMYIWIYQLRRGLLLREHCPALLDPSWQATRAGQLAGKTGFSADVWAPCSVGTRRAGRQRTMGLLGVCHFLRVRRAWEVVTALRCY